jgi:3-oxoacyl-[acyl-carrier-protein] synthase-1
VSAADIVAAAARTAVGASAEQSAAAFRARLSRFTLRRHRGDEVAVATASGVPAALAGPARVAWLLGDVVGALAAQMDALGVDPRHTALYAAVPQVAGWAIAAMVAEANAARPFAEAHALAGGHAIGLAAVAEAAALLAAGRARWAVVAAADSYIDAARLDALDGRLKRPGSADGFVPGEAAAALLLARDGGGRGARVSAIGLGEEPAPVSADRHSTGRGLGAALRGALGSPGAGAEPARWVLSDLNGESYRSFEWALVRARMAERFDAQLCLHHPADCGGDVGAATGPLLLATAATRLRRGLAPAPEAIAWCGSDDGPRAAARIERTTQEDPCQRPPT